MALSLYQASNRARKVIAVFAVLSLFLFVFQTVSNPKPKLTAPPETRYYVDPQNAFGSIDTFSITENNKIKYDTSSVFKIESDFDETFPDVANVYQLERPRQIFGIKDRASEVAASLGFDPNGYINRSSTVLEWKKANDTQTLTVDLESQSWDLKTAYFQNEFAIAKKTMLKQIADYLSPVNSLTSKLKFNTTGLDGSLVDNRYAKLGLDGVLLEATDYTTADYVIADVFRNITLADLKPKEQLPSNLAEKAPPPYFVKVYKSDPRKGSIRFVVSNRLNTYNKDVFSIDFTNFNYINKSPYLIVSPLEAWNLIQNGGGNLVFLQPKGSNYFGSYSTLKVKEFRADARRTELGYYEPEIWTGYSYPIYVFRGTAILEDDRFADFIFYVDAIKRFN